ncbi:MAG: enoyl-CoA hydratase/isomerase family protein, partial [Desulfovermiculus sp.]|nr:enoyl-CoA hydratase/isomerase family protein [Desulfovermiculus sp.]
SDDKRFQYVLLYGQGGKGFCAGGDIKELARAVREQHIDEPCTSCGRSMSWIYSFTTFASLCWSWPTELPWEGGLAFAQVRIWSWPQNGPGWPCRSPESDSFRM